MDSTVHTNHSIPDKLYFKIGEVAKIVGVKPFVLRYWESEFPDIAPAKTQSQQRFYKKKEVERILKIRDLLYLEKFTIEGARKRLKELLKEERSSQPESQMALFKIEDGLDPAILEQVKSGLEEVLNLLKE